jgi:carbon-monoxide dehydrogenase medium subunit
MKPAPFEYFAPETIEEALSHLAQHGYDAKPLAGGQSLIPMMNFRLAQPAVLIDLNRISDLSFIRPDQNGGLLIGAMTRHAHVERDQLIAERAPLIHETMSHIATPQIRSRGTFGGSISHADPSAELVAESVLLGGRFHLRSHSKERWVPAEDFFIGIYTTNAEPEDLLTEIAIPPLPSRSGWALKEVSRRPHDFALVGVAVLVSLNQDQRCQSARIGLFSVGDGPVEAHKAVEALIGQAPTSEAVRAAAEIASTEDIDPSSDIHATAAYRRYLAKTLTQRALETAFERARSNVH